MSVPKIKPMKSFEYESQQSSYAHTAKLPTRSLILGPSGGGKTVLLQSMILDIYKNCFSRIYIFSPSIDVDMTWEPVKKYLSENLRQNEKKEKYLFDSYQPAELEKIIDTQHKVVEFMKHNKMRKVFQILIIIDDFADDPSFTRNSRLLHSLYIRGRHTFISTITATQVYKAISPVIRKNITDLYIFRLRNYADMEAWLEEMSAIYDKKTLIALYNNATGVPFGFLYIKVNATKKEDMFYSSLQHKLIPKNSNE
jgi:carboxylesterase type B